MIPYPTTHSVQHVAIAALELAALQAHALATVALTKTGMPEHKARECNHPHKRAAKALVQAALNTHAIAVESLFRAIAKYETPQAHLALPRGILAGEPLGRPQGNPETEPKDTTPNSDLDCHENLDWESSDQACEVSTAGLGTPAESTIHHHHHDHVHSHVTTQTHTHRHLHGPKSVYRKKREPVRDGWDDQLRSDIKKPKTQPKATEVSPCRRH